MDCGTGAGYSPADMESFDEIMQKRLAAAEESIRKATPEALEQIGQQMFPMVDHPWHQPYFDFIHKHAASEVLIGEANDVYFLYAPEADAGLWFVIGEHTSGGGLLQERGKNALREIARNKGFI